MDRQDNQATGQVDSKKLFQYLKNSRTDQQGIPPLKKNDNLHTETKDKADILNQQFQSVFTPLAPLSLKELSLMKVQDLVDDKVIPPEARPEDQRNSTPVMPSIKISEAGIVPPQKPETEKGSRPRQNQTCRPTRTKRRISSNP